MTRSARMFLILLMLAGAASVATLMSPSEKPRRVVVGGTCCPSTGTPSGCDTPAAEWDGAGWTPVGRAARWDKPMGEQETVGLDRAQAG